MKSKPLAWEPTLGTQDVEIQSTELLYEGNYTLKRYTLRHRLFLKGWTPWLQREHVIRRDAVAVILYDPKLDKVILVEQFRIGPLDLPYLKSPWMLETVAGLLDEEESPENTAFREAQEEAGVQIKTLEFISSYFNTPGGFAERTFVYCGLVDATHAGGIHGLDHEHEDIKVHVLSFGSVMDLLKEGWLTSASTVIALQWLEMNRDRLKQN